MILFYSTLTVIKALNSVDSFTHSHTHSHTCDAMKVSGWTVCHGADMLVMWSRWNVWSSNLVQRFLSERTTIIRHTNQLENVINWLINQVQLTINSRLTYIYLNENLLRLLNKRFEYVCTDMFYLLRAEWLCGVNCLDWAVHGGLLCWVHVYTALYGRYSSFVLQQVSVQ